MKKVIAELAELISTRIKGDIHNAEYEIRQEPDA